MTLQTPHQGSLEETIKKNLVHFERRRAGHIGIDLNTETLMVDSFYAFVPGFASQVIHLDGDRNNNNIDNFLPLFGVEEEQAYYIDLLSRQENFRVFPVINITLDDDDNLDDYLVTDDGRIYSMKARQWLEPRLAFGYHQTREIFHCTR